MSNTNDTQQGGEHYLNKKIQPWDFIEGNNLPYLEGNVVKYVCRHADKGGLEDLKKARHYIDKLIEARYTKVYKPAPVQEEEEETAEAYLLSINGCEACED
jgi:hypothetical protein